MSIGSIKCVKLPTIFLKICCFLQNPFATQLTLQSNVSQIEGASMRNTYGFRVSMQNVKDAKALHEVSN